MTNKIFIYLILNLTCIFPNIIGCLDPDNDFYNENADINYFSGTVEGGSSCNQNSWNANYIGINLNYYLNNSEIFKVGNLINFENNTYYIDTVVIPDNCNSGVALVYVAIDQSYADGNLSTFEQGVNWPSINVGSNWTIYACLCENYIDCNNVCGGFDFSCLNCSMGDFNNDENINVSDIIVIINCILGISSCEDCFDINNDLLINVSDVVILVNIILNMNEGCLDPNACNFDYDADFSCDNCCHYESIFYDCEYNCLIDDNSDGICDNEPYEEFFIGMNLNRDMKDLFIINAIRFEEICHSNLYHLKNPLWTIYQTGTWPIYYHIESWNGEINDISINNLTNQYQNIANQWLEGLSDYDSDAPTSVEVKVFGFALNNGVNYSDSFILEYGDYPIVTNYELTNEESPWEIRFFNNDEVFNQNWYTIPDYLDLYVHDNRLDLNSDFSPNTWIDFTHPENINQFVTKFWHKTSWDAVAQRQYLKIGGQIYDYTNGHTNYRVFAHEMGHCFFLDDIYDSQKYPDGQSLVSIMNLSNSISDFDKFLLRLVWKNQKLYQIN